MSKNLRFNKETQNGLQLINNDASQFKWNQGYFLLKYMYINILKVKKIPILKFH